MRIDRSTGNYVDAFSGGVFVYQRGALEITPDRSKLLFANRGLSPGTVGIFDISGEAPELIIKNGHGDLGSNGQDLSVDPVNGAFFSYAVGGGNGAGYTIAKVSIDDMSWFGEFPVGAYPRAVHHSADGLSTYTNNQAGVVNIWDSSNFQLLDTFSVAGNPKDFAESRNNTLVSILSDQEFAIYQVGEDVPEPELSGYVDGGVLSKMICFNDETSQQVTQYLKEVNQFDCASAGLDISPGDRVRITLHGSIAE